MILYLAEKPSLARLIKTALDDIDPTAKVEFCIGHMYELASAKCYSIDYAKWDVSTLPIIPDEFKLVAKKETKEQLNKLLNIINSMASEDTIVNCGDPDREGQLLVDEVIESSGFKGIVMRAWLKDLSPNGLNKSLKNLRPNLEYESLTKSAKARNMSDWLIGINLTVAYTCKAQDVGYQSTLSVGRVQTPTLNLIVERDENIRNFKPKTFYTGFIKLEKDGTSFMVKETGDKCFDKEIANKKNDAVSNKVEIKRYQTKRVKKSPPKLFTLADLQSFCNKAFGMSANETLVIAQSLYEKHQVLTYPRSDCNYLNENEFEKSLAIKNILADRAGHKLSNDMPDCFNDKKVGAHTAIIPTDKTPIDLSDKEKQVYDAVCKRFMAQFAPGFEFDETVVETTVNETIYKATGKTLINAGWCDVTDPGKDHFKKATVLPVLEKGEMVKVKDKEVVTQMTQPPKHFTEGTLITAMSNISRYLEDKEHKSTLIELGGIGTEATRASIIETLKKRKYVVLDKKNIISTAEGVKFCKLVMEDIKSAVLTANWENKFSDIENGKLDLDDYMEEFKKWIKKITSKATKQNLDVLAGKKCPKCDSGYIISKKGRYGAFSGCNQYPECKYIETKSSAKGKPRRIKRVKRKQA